ncbi:MAG: hypothetical protein QOF84_3823 [Streptomyces sp.]|nr:hypothetical protein [Streptomyces sp.]
MSTPSPTPPFARVAARRLREQLGMAHGHVTHAMRASYGLLVAPETLAAWERGTESPSGPEIQALAGALWCDPADLLGAPGTLLEHRWVRGLAASDLARMAGVPLKEYERMERRNQWAGTSTQTAALRTALGLSPPELLRLTGQGERLAELLRDAASTRWQAYVRQVAAIAPVPRPRIENAMERLHSEYQALIVATLSWGGGSAEDRKRGADFLDTVTDRFWAAVAD